MITARSCIEKSQQSMWGFPKTKIQIWRILQISTFFRKEIQTHPENEYKHPAKNGQNIEVNSEVKQTLLEMQKMKRLTRKGKNTTNNIIPIEIPNSDTYNNTKYASKCSTTKRSTDEHHTTNQLSTNAKCNTGATNKVLSLWDNVYVKNKTIVISPKKEEKIKERRIKEKKNK